MSNNRSGIFIAGLLIGGVVGAVTGLLLAPRSGRETRKLLKKSADALPNLAEDLSSTMQVQADRLSDSALRNWDSTLTRLKDALSAGIEATQQDLELSQKPPANLPKESRSPVHDHSR
jgi:gas vesicle protein